MSSNPTSPHIIAFQSLSCSQVKFRPAVLKAMLDELAHSS